MKKPSNFKDRHPTEKPLELMEQLVKTYSLENETILDFTGGSGTTALACLKNNRKCIIIEKEAKYINLIIRKLDHYHENN